MEPPRVPCAACFAPHPLDPSSTDPRCPDCGGALAPLEPLELSEETLATYLVRAEVPVLLLITGDGCALCPGMRGVHAELAGHLAGACLFAVTRGEAAPQAAQAFGITHVPETLLVHRGAIVDRVRGALEVHDLGRWLAGHLQVLAGGSPPG